MDLAAKLEPLGIMISREQAVTLLNPFSDGDQSLKVKCGGVRPRHELIPPGDNLRLITPNQAWVDLTVEHRNLRALWLDKPTAKSLDKIPSLPLEHFSITYPSHVRDWQFLSKLRGLRYLRIYNATSLSTLDDIADLVQLQVLILGGSYSRDMKVPSLKPLARLTDLRVVMLVAFRPQDWSLEPLHGMRQLEHFCCPSTCPRDELLAMQARHPKLDLINGDE